MTLNITGLSVGGQITDITAAASTGRTLGGVVLKYGHYGLTSKGRLKVAPGALSFPADLGVVKFTREHDRQAVRGYLTAVEDDGTQLRVVASISDGPEGDEAVREAQGRIREGLSFDIVDATVVGDTITAGRVVAIGQVGVPAYDDGRIDQIAANLTTEGTTMTEEQRARLAELAVATSRNTEEEAELVALLGLLTGGETPAEEPVTAAAVPPASTTTEVAASMPAVPGSVPRPTGTPTQVRESGAQALRRMIAEVTAAFSSTNKAQAITAALQDITHTAHTDNIEPIAWSGELFSGVQYVPEWTDLFSSGPLTNWRGQGWRFTSKLEIQDYAGDKAAIPSDNVTTEDSSYVAARMAVGVDIDRKFFDFPNEGFIQSLFQQVAESWDIQLDGKIRAYALTNAVAAQRTATVTLTSGDATVTAPVGTFRPSDVGSPFTVTGTGVPASTTILTVTNSGSIELSANASASGVRVASFAAQEPTLIKAAARAVLDLKRRRVGPATWIKVNDEDMFSLLDVTDDDVPAWLNLWGIEPSNFRSDPDVPRGSVMAGVRQAATVRTLPGSPIRVEAQNIANGGVDEGFFGYWAIEEHHTSGITTVAYTPV